MLKKSIGVVIPTLNAAQELNILIPKIKKSHCNPEILIVDSSSNDNTLEIANKYLLKVISIQRKDFNHGLTRELGRKYLNKDIIVMLSQDIVPVSDNFIDILIHPIESGLASISYARQIPHKNANFIASFPRYFNYPDTSHTRCIKDINIYGVYTFFCSDSCAAYLNSSIEAMGGFPETIVAEDYLVTAKILIAGHKISYITECIVEHSHNYSLKDEFRRSFDTGVYRKRNKWIENYVGTADKRGIEFVKKFLLMAIKTRLFYIVPYIILQSLSKFIGYRLGYLFGSINNPIFKHLSMHPKYWR